MENYNNKLLIGIDFDGTCVTHSFPELGHDIGAIPVLKRLLENGHKLILWTMRSNMLTPTGGVTGEIVADTKGNFLNIAIKWFNDNGIELYGVQTNPTQKNWTESPKAYCNLYIDDAALGCPLKYDESLSIRPFVNWNEVEIMLELKGILK